MQLIVYRHRLVVSLTLLVLLGCAFLTVQPLAAAPCFPGVPNITTCIDSRFGTFWAQSGGLPVFGYPITGKRNEVNADTATSYPTQWFERNRFEQHSENALPYDVLLGRLGDEVLKLGGRDWHNEPSTDNPLGGSCQHFDVTNRDVCGPFLTYWRQHGLNNPGLDPYNQSLQLFGLPLTGVKSEKNPNGDTVLTQWFERARFELHPEVGNIVLLGLLGRERLAGARPASPPHGPVPVAVTSLTTITPNGGRADWSPVDSNLLAFDKLGADGFYYVATMHPDGSSEVCLTCDLPDLPIGHKGNPAWHPSGRWLVFQAQKASTFPSLFSQPGIGTHSDLWVLSIPDHHVYQMTNTPATGDSGVLHPHFSSDGKKLSWSEMYRRAGSGPGQGYGYWTLKIADFIAGPGGTALANIQDVTPATPAIYENHGFSPDGTKLIFSTNANLLSPDNPYSIVNIFTIDIGSGLVTQLTHSEGGHNEHAAYSPDGTRIIWMSGRDNTNGGTDFWIMNSDGSSPQRLTYYNQPGYPEYRGFPLYAAKSSWSPDGTQFVGYVQDSLIKQTGGNVIVSLNTPPATNPYNPFVR